MIQGQRQQRTDVRAGVDKIKWLYNHILQVLLVQPSSYMTVATYRSLRRSSLGNIQSVVVPGTGRAHKASYHLAIVFVIIIVIVRVLELEDPLEAILLDSLIRKLRTREGK